MGLSCLTLVNQGLDPISECEEVERNVPPGKRPRRLTMNWILLSVLAVLAVIGMATWIIRSRSRDIEEVILQGRPVLLRCGKLRVTGKASACSQGDPSIKGC